MFPKFIFDDVSNVTGLLSVTQGVTKITPNVVPEMKEVV
jgi:hypothetical protein